MLKIFESVYLVKQEETARSVKRRAKKKWAKPRFITVPDLSIYQMPEGIICHPIMAHQIRRELFKASEG